MKLGATKFIHLKMIDQLGNGVPSHWGAVELVGVARVQANRRRALPLRRTSSLTTRVAANRVMTVLGGQGD